jgi:hypothetical protein
MKRAEKACKEADRRYRDVTAIVDMKDRLAATRKMLAWAIVEEIEEVRVLGGRGGGLRGVHGGVSSTI